MKKIFVITSILVLTFSLASCNFPLAGGNTDTAVQTAVAMNLALTQLAQTLTAAVPVVAPTTAPPTLNPVTATASLTPSPTLTPTLAGVWLTVLENTNCRSGPGTMYDWVALISAGVKAEAVARNPVNDYYYVKNPNSASGFCWLWSKYSSISGNITTLPVFTPQPTPTVATPTPVADFSLNYLKLEQCLSYTLELKVTNTGSVSWQSIHIRVKDNNTGQVVEESSNSFGSVNGCALEESQGDLTSNEWSRVATGYFSVNPTGHNMKVTVTLYSKDDWTGTSVTKSISVTP